mmetsp:Transcript_30745/g.74957  ORF Transcript_30745/g.74957 Transcript_30745/m.74957 type:complete len:235 (-) Transcript_30745:591-1295(-)
MAGMPKFPTGRQAQSSVLEATRVVGTPRTSTREDPRERDRAQHRCQFLNSRLVMMRQRRNRKRKRPRVLVVGPERTKKKLRPEKQRGKLEEWQSRLRNRKRKRTRRNQSIPLDPSTQVTLRLGQIPRLTQVFKQALLPRYSKALKRAISISIRMLLSSVEIQSSRSKVLRKKALLSTRARKTRKREKAVFGQERSSLGSLAMAKKRTSSRMLSLRTKETTMMKFFTRQSPKSMS